MSYTFIFFSERTIKMYLIFSFVTNQQNRPNTFSQQGVCKDLISVKIGNVLFSWFVSGPMA